jgi:AcrR family transcriptional regulator
MSKPANPELARKILDIALTELSAKAPEEINMRDIAEGAGVSSTAIYYYFASKDALFERIKFDAMDELDSRLSASTRSVAGPNERLAAFIRAYAAWCLERPHLAKLLLEDLPPKEPLDDEAMRKYYASFFRARDIVEEAIAAGSLGDRDALLDVSIAQAAIWGIVSQFRSKRVHPRFWNSIDPLIERFIQIYLGDQGGDRR